MANRKNIDRLTHEQIKRVTDLHPNNREHRECKCGGHLTLFGKDEFSCKGGAGVSPCKADDLAAWLRGKVNPKKASAKEEWLGLTLAQYEKDKGFTSPAGFPTAPFGVYETTRRGLPVVAFPYANTEGVCTAIKLRYGSDPETKKKHYEWLPGEHDKKIILPYGLFLWWAQKAAAKDLLICEGESDTQTFAWHDIAALGISGKDGWKSEFAELPVIRNAERIFICQEPDCGDEFVETIRPDLRGKTIYAVRFPDDAPDPNSLHLKHLNDKWENKAEEPDPFIRALNDLLPSKAKPLDTIPLTQSGNAERLVSQYGQEFRWLNDIEEFRTWNGELWEPSRGGQGRLLEFTKYVARGISDEEWALKSESQGHRHAMITLAKGEPAVFATHEQFDTRPMLLNVSNGTIDLETQNLREFSRADFLTFKAPVVYDPFAECPRFDTFLNETFGGDNELIHYIVKTMGYTLTGDAGAQCFFICLGSGANGKTQLLEIMTHLLGPRLSAVAKSDVLLDTRGFQNSAEYELAKWSTRRLLTVSEPRASGHFNDNLLKNITGGEVITGRPIFGRPIDYRPQFKLWMAMNNAPRIDTNDDAVWRRVRYIRFDHIVPPERRIPDLGMKLVREEGSGILNRLLCGVADWLAEGLNPPASVVQGTQAFRETQDPIKRFIDERGVLEAKAKLQCSKLYAAYERWCQDRDEPVMSSVAFSRELEKKNFQKGPRKSYGEEWLGIRLQEV